MKCYPLPLLFVFSLYITGCGNSGAFVSNNSTEVQLRENNYNIVAINVTGSAEKEYLLGGSYSLGMITQSFGLIPLSGTRTMYKDAREDLWNTFENQNGPVQGRTLALTNVQFDAITINYFFYTKVIITITADVIEFE